jgi:hypothetical protein
MKDRGEPVQTPDAAGAEQALRRRIESAFPPGPPPPAGELLHPAFASSVDAEEMRDCFAGRRWTDLSIEELFWHREMVVTLSAVGYRAYLPAYLTACLADHPRMGADLRGYLLLGLRPLSGGELDVSSTRERLSLLDPAQRAAVAAVLRHLEARWGLDEAGEILREWA